MGRSRVLALAIGWLAILPSVALAQASITGVVRDSSGAVLPPVVNVTNAPQRRRDTEFFKAFLCASVARLAFVLRTAKAQNVSPL